MKNLKRYNFNYGPNWGGPPEVANCKDGEWVKFSDIKDILKPSHNNERDVIFSNNICHYCKTLSICQKPCNSMKFVGKKLTPVS